jgi:hypothetical protein
MSPKFLLISSLQLLDSIRDELRAGDWEIIIRGRRGTTRLLKTDLPAIEKPKRLKS